MASSVTLTLLWNGKPVGEITDWTLVDWPWLAGTFTPGDFPKHLADYLTWRRSQPPDEGDEPFGEWDAWFLAGEWANWSIRSPDGTVKEVWVSHVNQTGGVIEWR
jgi:hypothetical protein